MQQAEGKVACAAHPGTATAWCGVLLLSSMAPNVPTSSSPHVHWLQLTMAILLGGYIIVRDAALRGLPNATWHGWSMEALRGWPTYLRCMQRGWDGYEAGLNDKLQSPVGAVVVSCGLCMRSCGCQGALRSATCSQRHDMRPTPHLPRTQICDSKRDDDLL